MAGGGEEARPAPPPPVVWACPGPVNEGGTVNIKAARTMTIRILAMVDDLFNAVMGRRRFRKKGFTLRRMMTCNYYGEQ